MVVNKRKKSTRARGQRSHFYGSHKKHRGAGHRGGRGNAGSGKKADQKKPSLWKDTEYFGGHGFTSKSRISTHAISIKDVALNLPHWVSQGVASSQAGSVKVDLNALGYNKLLSNGEAPKKLTVVVSYATASAVEKISSAGGSVEGLLEKKAKKAPKSDA